MVGKFQTSERVISHYGLPDCLHQSVLASKFAAIYPILDLFFSAVFLVEFATRTISL